MKMRDRIFAVMIAVAAVSVIGLTLFFMDGKESAESQSKTKPLRLGYSAWVGCWPIVIAREKGYFDENNVNVETVFSTDLIKQRSDFAAGNLDGVFQTLGDLLRTSHLSGDPRVVLCCDVSHGGDAVVAVAEIESLADLRGKRIGAALGTFSEIFILEMLEANGMNAGDVAIRHCAPEQVPEMLRRGEIQAGHTWDPHLHQALQDGGHVIFDSRQTPGLILDMFAFHNYVLRERPEDARAFLRAWFQAINFWLEHPDEAAILIAKSENVPKESVTLDGIKLLTVDGNRRLFDLGSGPESMRANAQIYTDFYIKTGQLAQPLEINTIFQPGYLPESDAALEE